METHKTTKKKSRNANANVRFTTSEKSMWRVHGGKLKPLWSASRIVNLEDGLGSSTGGNERRNERKSLQPG